MEPASSSNPDFTSVDGAAVVEGFNHSVDEISAKVDTVRLLFTNYKPVSSLCDSSCSFVV